jgi:purine-cytosine permease-like protein
VVVGQILSAVSDYKMTLAVGCVIIAVLSYIISIFGFKVIHTVEKYSWILSAVLLVVLLAQIGGKVDPSIPAPTTGLAFSGAMLSYIALCFSSSSGWCSIASDYYCNYPAKTPSWKIFSLTLVGVTIPTVFTTLVGVCLGSIVTLQTDASTAYLTEAYDDHGLGGLLREAYHPLAFSKFCLIFLVFTVLGNNVAINYSSGLSLQLLGHYFHAIPRFIWSFANALVIAVLAIAGREHLSTIVSNFVSLLGYWTVSFTFILLIEDQFYRRKVGYNLSVWNTPSKLPMGLAAVLALIVGYCAGGVTGMSQTWYVGPIARMFSSYGGDVGVYLSGAFTIAVYFPARYLERKMTSR